MQHFKFVNWRIRFLMSRTGYFAPKRKKEETNNFPGTLPSFIGASQCSQYYYYVAATQAKLPGESLGYR